MDQDQSQMPIQFKCNRIDRVTDYSSCRVIEIANPPKWRNSKYILLAFNLTNSGGLGVYATNSGHNSVQGTLE